MNSYIVDDDRVSVEIISQFCKTLGHFNVVGSASNASDTISFLNNNHVDVIFLDIKLPDINGYDLLSSLVEKPGVIIISSEAKYAVRSYEFEVIDFLLKPISKKRFLKTTAKAQKYLRDQLDRTRDDVRSIYVKKKDIYVRIPVNDIRWIQSQSNYCVIYTDSNRYTVYSSLTKLIKQLPESIFCRVHRSYIINMEKVESYGDNMISIDNELIPVSKSSKKEFQDRLNLF